MAANERDNYTPKIESIVEAELKGSLKALNVEDGDLVVFRMFDATPKMMRQTSDVMNRALKGMGSKAIALIIDDRMDIERIPHHLAYKLLEGIREAKLDAERSKPIPELSD